MGAVTTPLVRALRVALEAPGAPASGSHVLVAVSGGPDSTALLAALHSLAPAHGLRVSAGHVNHGLRGADSDGDAAAVASLAASLGIPCVAAGAPVAPGGNLEDRARIVRRRALRELAHAAGADVIALAHTEDDQVETVLLRLLRGAGRGGLGGMWPRRGRLWRPFLGVTRADVRRYLANEGLPFRIDRTNADLRHARNRLRRLVIPLLARETNPRIGPAIAALATRLRDEDALLAALATERAAVHRLGDGLAIGVAGEPPALARRIVRAWLDSRGLTTIAAREAERILALARGATGGHVGVRGPARIVREKGVLVCRRGRRATAASFHHQVSGACAIDGPGGAWRLSVSPPRAAGRDDATNLNARRVRFDADTLALPLAVRPVAPGDRIGVPGVGTRKLQDVFVDAKVPRERRGLVPVVTDAVGAVVWVPGLVRSGTARLTATTTRVLELQFEAEDDDE